MTTTMYFIALFMVFLTGVLIGYVIRFEQEDNK